MDFERFYFTVSCASSGYNTQKGAAIGAGLGAIGGQATYASTDMVAQAPLQSPPGKSMRYIVALLLFLLFVPSLFAQDSYADFERGLQLTDSQKMKVEEIKKKYINEWRSTKQEVVRKRLELRELSRNQPGNTERIEKLQNEISDIESSRENLYNQYRGEVSRALNDEQKEKYNNFCTSERRRMMRPLGMRGYGR